MKLLLPEYLKKSYLNNNIDLADYPFNTIIKHYSFFGEKENRCKFIKDAFEKINGIEGICWINLNRSMERNLYMNFILQYCNVPSYRIDAIDGRESLDEYYAAKEEHVNTNMTQFEIACLLSHLKALDYIKKLSGKYFAICEDDISVENIQYFKNMDIKKIISDAPKFDLLMISHTSDTYFEKTYIDWNDEYKKNNHVAGTVFYIVNVKNININIDNVMIMYDKKMHINIFMQNADILLYKNCKTFIYQYNFITCINIDSEIHNDHIEHHIHMHKKNTKHILNQKNI